MFIDLPAPKSSAWLNHARDFAHTKKNGYFVTYNVFYSINSKLNHVGQTFGVMDDFGNFQEVKQ